MQNLIYDNCIVWVDKLYINEKVSFTDQQVGEWNLIFWLKKKTQVSTNYEGRGCGKELY